MTCSLAIPLQVVIDLVLALVGIPYLVILVVYEIVELGTAFDADAGPRYGRGDAHGYNKHALGQTVGCEWACLAEFQGAFDDGTSADGRATAS